MPLRRLARHGLQLVVYYYFYAAPPHALQNACSAARALRAVLCPHLQCQHDCGHAHIFSPCPSQRAMLLLPCTCSCDAPNGNAADVDSSIMRLSAGVTVLVYLGGMGIGIYFKQVQVL